MTPARVPPPHDAPTIAGDAATLASGTTGEPTPLLRPGATIGRYRIQGQLGSGGMGVVYSAHDPELERTVAIKLLRSDAAAADAVRLLREARALARLAHPNIVAVHDAGETADGQLFIAMELVDGPTARAWLLAHPRALPDILDLYTAAGRGLAAAHHAGLVHRDFKPDNLMVGRDGRARVMDFGLARALDLSALTTQSSAPQGDSQPTEPDLRLTRAGSLLGTPMYMAPEQWDGRIADERSDQFAYCVALWEAVHGARPFTGATLPELMLSVTRGVPDPPRPSRRVPAWLTKILARGLARAPERRWPSMDHLLAALARGAARQRRRPLLALALVALVLLTILLALRARTDAQCTAAAAAITEQWNDDARASLRAALLATGVPYADATYTKAAPILDEYAAAWSAARASTCQTTAPPDRQARTIACLDDARETLAAFLAVFAADSAAHVERLVLAAAELPSIAACTDPAALARRPAPPTDPTLREPAHALRRDLLHARGQLAAGVCTRVDTAESLLTRAETLADPPLILTARVLLADLAICRDDDRPLTEQLLRQVYVDAEAIDADETAVTAATELLSIIGRDRARAAEALQWSLPAEAILKRIDQADGLLAADLYQSRAVVLRSRGDLPESLADMQRALEIQERLLGPDHPAIASALNVLGAIHRSRGDQDAALAAQTRELAIRRAALPAGHPAIAVAANDLGLLEQSRGNYTEARQYFTEALEIAEAVRGPDHRHIAIYLNNLGRLQQLRGDLADARRLLKRALEIRERTSPGDLDVASTLHNLGLLYLLQGDRLGAREAFARVLQIRERKLADGHPELVAILDDLGTLHYRTGNFDDALALHERTLAIHRARTPPNHRATANGLRNIALVRDAQGDHTDALKLASEAVQLGEQTLGPDHPDLVTLLNTLGMIQRRTDLAAAEATLARSLAISVRARGNRHPSTATSMLRLGEVYLARRAFTEAQASLDEALAIRESLAHDSPEVADVLVPLGDLALARGAPATAVPLLERALKIRDQGGISRRQLAEVRFALARALRLTSPSDPRARQLADQAAETYAAEGPATAAELAAVRAWLTSRR